MHDALHAPFFLDAHGNYEAVVADGHHGILQHIFL